MLDRLVVFSLLAHAVQAAILFVDTRGWRAEAGGPAQVLWRLRLGHRLPRRRPLDVSRNIKE
jgi:hypothetical protein